MSKNELLVSALKEKRIVSRSQCKSFIEWHSIVSKSEAHIQVSGIACLAGEEGIIRSIFSELSELSSTDFRFFSHEDRVFVVSMMHLLGVIEAGGSVELVTISVDGNNFKRRDIHACFSVSSTLLRISDVESLFSQSRDTAPLLSYNPQTRVGYGKSPRAG